MSFLVSNWKEKDKSVLKVTAMWNVEWRQISIIEPTYYIQVFCVKLFGHHRNNRLYIKFYHNVRLLVYWLDFWSLSMILCISGFFYDSTLSSQKCILTRLLFCGFQLNAILNVLITSLQMLCPSHLRFLICYISVWLVFLPEFSVRNHFKAPYSNICWIFRYGI